MSRSSIYFFLAIVWMFSSCNPFSKNEMSEEETLITKQMHDEYVLSGKHGYFTVISIVGRIKTKPITQGLPANINVQKINAELLGRALKFKILDSLNYQVSYPKNEKEEGVIKGRFEKVSGDGQIQLLVLKTFGNDVLESAKMIDYTFRVYSY